MPDVVSWSAPSLCILSCLSVLQIEELIGFLVTLHRAKCKVLCTVVLVILPKRTPCRIDVYGHKPLVFSLMRFTIYSIDEIYDLFHLLAVFVMQVVTESLGVGKRCLRKA